MARKEQDGEIINPPIKQSRQSKAPNEQARIDPDFEARARAYQEQVELLQKKFDIAQRPIITPYGPDIQLFDATPQEEKPQTETIARI